MKIILAKPRGFCAGVERAIDIVEKALLKFGAPVYVRHQIVHNKYVVDDLTRKGVIFVKETDEVPNDAVVIFSAHGVAENVEQSAKLRDLMVIDATCPLVKKVHFQAIKNEKMGNEIILIGHNGHPEVIGTAGRVKEAVHIVESVNDVAKLNVDDPTKLSYVTQTTLSVDDTKDIITALKKRFPAIIGPELKDICYATTNRQEAVKELTNMVDLILVIGAKNSSNSNRLKDLSNQLGVEAYLIDSSTDINPAWLDNVNIIGLTAGASAPEILVEQTLEKLEEITGHIEVSVMNGIDENVYFKLPKEVA